ncbi:MAG TPA: acyltransferase family protein [Sphingobium sp.]|nr:acyltransferase family protein [Sphingobium sp.]
MTTNLLPLRAAGEREHHWDAIRALLMLLGIPYHVAMAYRAGQGWIMNSGEGALTLTWLAQAIHAFRMPAFFIIAGYFAALLLSRRAPGPWLRGRFTRLAVPFTAAILTLNPLLNLLCELSNFQWAPALRSWGHESATSGGYWVRHLWFLIVLLYCSTVAALLCHLFPRLSSARMPARIDALLARHLFWTLLGAAVLLGLWEAAAIELFYMKGLATNLIQQILRIDQTIEFAPYFLIGALIARAPAFKAALYRFSPATALFAIAALTLDIMVRGDLWPPYGRFLDTLAAVSMTQLLVATIKQISDRPRPLVQEMVRASFVIYLFHLPITAALVLIAKPLAIPVIVKALLVMALTLALSYGVWLLIRRSPLLLFLFDGTRARPPVPVPPLATRDLGRQSL